MDIAALETDEIDLPGVETMQVVLARAADRSIGSELAWVQSRMDGVTRCSGWTISEQLEIIGCPKGRERGDTAAAISRLDALQQLVEGVHVVKSDPEVIRDVILNTKGTLRWAFRGQSTIALARALTPIVESLPATPGSLVRTI